MTNQMELGDYEIQNRHESDTIHIIFGGESAGVCLSISREDGQVYVLLRDEFDGSEYRMTLGQKGYTNKL
ncbi:MAG: hypothetical protein EB127_10170 [Alphaproteobacteria bacterium]|nr:hypothetical protein [Alphaproteobacteria bacterium]